MRFDPKFWENVFYFHAADHQVSTSFRWNFLDKRSRGTVRVINFSYPRKAITIFFFFSWLEKKRKIEEEEE